MAPQQNLRGPLQVKIVRTEGFLALWRGARAHLLRVVPHLTLVYVSIEELKKLG